ncbi:MAG: GNAT family N-acetyltransferase [Eubacteriales bacterium]|nr:GNAT family N-acetyltransferase [Eubacteriales bacterium]
MHTRRFEDRDAEKIAALIGRNFLEVNSRDYPLEEMRTLAETYNADKVRSIASYAHTYVVCEGGTVVGTGSISSFWGSTTESILLTVFVLPEYHGKGVGRQIIETLEADELFLRARRVEIPASITACRFYEKMGYGYKDGVRQLDEEGHYRMEKFRQI